MSSDTNSHDDLKMKLNEKVDALDKLTQVVSRNFSTSNRYLLALLLTVTVSILGVIDHKPNEMKTYAIYNTSETTRNNTTIIAQNAITNKFVESIIKEDKNDDLEIPFIGKVSKDYFLSLAVTLISLLMLLFSITQSHAIRSKKLISKLVSNIDFDFVDKKYNHMPIINRGDLIDAFIVSGLTKTAPLTQLQLGEHQFLHDSHLQDVDKKACLFFLDKIIKYISMAIIYLYPFVSLIYLYCGLYDQVGINDILRVALLFPIILALLSICMLATQDINSYSEVEKKVLGRIKRMQKTQEIAEEKCKYKSNHINQSYPGYIRDKISDIKDKHAREYVCAALFSKRDFFDFMKLINSDDNEASYIKIRNEISKDFFGKENVDFSEDCFCKKVNQNK